jgi:hypothetical protein
MPRYAAPCRTRHARHGGLQNSIGARALHSILSLAGRGTCLRIKQRAAIEHCVFKSSRLSVHVGSLSRAPASSLRIGRCDRSSVYLVGSQTMRHRASLHNIPSYVLPTIPIIYTHTHTHTHTHICICIYNVPRISRYILIFCSLYRVFSKTGIE